MKVIDTRFPFFMQLEAGDSIFVINLSEEHIEEYPIHYVRDGSIIYGDNLSFDFSMRDAVLKNHFMLDNGCGWATCYEAANEAVQSFINEKISKYNSLIESKKNEIYELESNVSYLNRVLKRVL